MGSIVLDMIKHHEGLRFTVYDDATGRPIVPESVVTGYPTIGYGRNLATRGISQEEADYLLAHDLTKVFKECSAAFPWFDKLSEARSAVVMDMVFNLGMAGFKKFKETILAIEAGDYVVAAKNMLASRWSVQVGKRARTLARMMAEDVGFEEARKASA
jgi:lysozyme